MKNRASFRDAEPPAMEQGHWLESITRFWVTVLIILAILYVAAYTISRSDGFRDIVQQRLSTLAGTPLSIASAKSDVFMNLVLEGVNDSANYTNQLPGIEIKYAKLKWRWIPLLTGKGWPFSNLHIRNAAIRFTSSANATWQPLPELQSRLGPWMELPVSDTNQTPELITETMRRTGVNITLENVSIVWRSGLPDEPPLAIVEGVDLKTSPQEPFDDSVTWFVMDVGRAESGEVEWLNNVAMEWIRLPDADVILRQTGTILSKDQRTWQRKLLMEQ